MTKICIISDTHGMHLGLSLPDADILVHCGDFSSHGTYMDALKFVNWLGAQPHKHKVFIAGNHDLYFEQGNPSDIDMFIKTMPPDVHYLQDSGIVLEGLKFWGSPVQPRFFNWAFNRGRGAEIKKHWDLIPEGIDVLLTHGPARFRQDEAPRSTQETLQIHPRTDRKPNTYYTEHTGCKDLLDAIQRVRPKIHACGHIHYSYGYIFAGNVHHYNASLVNEGYILLNKPFLVDVNDYQVDNISLL